MSPAPPEEVPNSARGWITWLPFLPLAVLGTVFAFQVAAGPHLFDAGELAAAAWHLGGSHPPGQPLHALVAHGFARLLPLGPIAGRMALLSGVCALAAALICARCTTLLLRAGAVASPSSGDRVAPTIRAGIVLAVCLSPVVLRQALRIEVYTLALLCSCAGLYGLLRWTLTGALSGLLHAGLFGGMAAATHPPHGAAVVAAGLVMAAACRPRVFKAPKQLTLTAGAFLIPVVAVYALLPMRANAGAPMWGDPTTWSGFIDYVSGRMYAANTFAGRQASFLWGLADYLSHLFHLTYGLPLAAAVGLPYLVGRRQPLRRLAWTLLPAVAASTAAVAVQPIEIRNPDNVAYLGPALALLWITGFAGLAYGLRHLEGYTCGRSTHVDPESGPVDPAASDRDRRMARTPRAGRLVTPSILLATMVFACLPAALWQDLDDALRSDLPALETLAGMWTDGAPPRSLVVATTDATAANWIMARALDGARPDAALFVRGLAASSFHWRQLTPHPAFDGRPRFGRGSGDKHERLLRGLLERARPQVPVYTETEAPGLERSTLMGPGLLSHPGATRASVIASRSIGERLAAQLARDRRRTPDGDHGLAAGILRQHELIRVRRLLARGGVRAALFAVAAALPGLPKELRQAVLSAKAAGPWRPPPSLVEDPQTLFFTRDEAEREAARHLWSMGEGGLAVSLLRLQAERGAPRALLQLALLQWAEGRPQQALRSAVTFRRATPELAREAERLIAALEASSAESDGRGHIE